ncbi:hypothetical protein Droror1_Dr00001777 [Drosera rotundifolia]
MSTPPPPSPLSLPLRTRIQLAVLDFITNRTLCPDGSVDRRLINLLDRPFPPNPVPRNSVSSHDFSLDPSRDLWFRLFVPSTADSTSDYSDNRLPVIVFFHGGGFALLSPASRSYDAVCRRFARRFNSVVVSVNYRRTPEHRFPAQFEDSLDVLRFLSNRRHTIPNWPINADLTKCFLAGDSAGGNLTHNVAIMYLQNENREIEFRDLRLRGLIVIQPFFGGKETAESETRLEGAPIVSLERTEWMWKAFLGPDGADKDHWAVNVSGPNAVELDGLELPPVVLFVGGFDPLRDWQLRYGEWLKRKGKDVVVFDYEKACHAFYVFPEIEETEKLIVEVGKFIRAQCSKV